MQGVFLFLWFTVVHRDSFISMVYGQIVGYFFSSSLNFLSMDCSMVCDCMSVHRKKVFLWFTGLPVRRNFFTSMVSGRSSLPEKD